MDNVVVWEINYKLVNEHMDNDINHDKPSRTSSNTEIKRLGNWTSQQMQNYKKRDKALKNENIYQQWEILINKYPTKFSGYNAKWQLALEDVEKYMETSENNDRPKKLSSNQNYKTMAVWLTSQVTKYRRNNKIMQDPEIREKWEEFVFKYPTKFPDTYEIILERRK